MSAGVSFERLRDSAGIHRGIPNTLLPSVWGRLQQFCETVVILTRNCGGFSPAV
jgi:hypothetical protein